MEPDDTKSLGKDWEDINQALSNMSASVGKLSDGFKSFGDAVSGFTQNVDWLWEGKKAAFPYLFYYPDEKSIPSTYPIPQSFQTEAKNEAIAMPIQVIKKSGSDSNNALTAMLQFGVSSVMVAWLKQHADQVKVNLSAKEFMLSVQGADSEAEIKGHQWNHFVPVTPLMLHALKDGTLDSASKMALAIQLEGKIKMVIEIVVALEDSGNTVQDELNLTADVMAGKDSMAQTKFAQTANDPVAVKNNTVDVMAMLPKAALPASTPAKASEQAKVGLADYPVFDLSALHTAPLMQLRDAKALYQPVKGTSAGSRYYLVASRNDLKIAVKWQSGTMSIRVEGLGLGAHMPKLTDAGFDGKGGTGYTSLHLQVDSDMIARKALGAIIMGVGLTFDTPFPNLHLLKNK